MCAKRQQADRDDCVSTAFKMKEYYLLQRLLNKSAEMSQSCTEF